jgi:hypothetical protein
MSKEIEVKNAKCRQVSLHVPVQFAKDEKRPDADFVMEAYTGQTVDRWWGKLAIDVSGIKAKKQIPIFRDHQRGNIVGYSNETWTDGSFFVAGKFSGATQHAAEVKALAKEGFPWQASIGVAPLKILALEDKAAYVVNGKEINGPAEVWLESEVFETSFVPLGADGNTSVSVFARFEEVQKPSAEDRPASTKENVEMEKENNTPAPITVETLKAGNPEIVAALLAEGAKAERDRIQSVLAQAMPGHEAMLQQLAFDGKTTGPEAAVAVLAAEKKIRSNAAQNLRSDAVPPVAPAPAPEPNVAENMNLPLEDRCKAKWQGSPELRAEFGNQFDRYMAFAKAEEAGIVRIKK